MDIKYIGRNIAKLRVARRLTQGELGAKIGLTSSAISNIENARSYPSIDALIRLANCFGVTVDYLLTDEAAKELNELYFEADNKPEYTGGSDDLLEQRYLDKYIPVQDDASGLWCVQMGYGFESGDANYIAAEFSGTGLIYHFMYNGEMDHVHGFDGVLAIVLQDPEHVDIVTDYDEYSEQEIQMIKAIKRAVSFVHSHHRPMTNAELRKNRAEIKNTGEDNYEHNY